jgi:hypothetical protein
VENVIAKVLNLADVANEFDVAARVLAPVVVPVVVPEVFVAVVVFMIRTPGYC